MSSKYEDEKFNYADGYIPNNPEPKKVNNTKSKKTKSGGSGFAMTIILAMFIIAVGILVNVILQLKANEKKNQEQLESVKKQIEVYRDLISEIDYNNLNEEDTDETDETIFSNTAVENIAVESITENSIGDTTNTAAKLFEN